MHLHGNNSEPALSPNSALIKGLSPNFSLIVKGTSDYTPRIGAGNTLFEGLVIGGFRELSEAYRRVIFLGEK